MNTASERPLIASAVTLGIGMGGFLDGIVFHQLLQLHNMLSAKFPPTSVVNLEINMFWDGLFHAACWLISLIGIFMVWSVVRRASFPLRTRALVGGMLIGWGLFNLVEGVIDHHILHLHHVTEAANHLVWDLAFLASGLVLIAAGMLALRRPEALPSAQPSPVAPKSLGT